MIDARLSPEAQAVILACKRVDAPMRKAIFAASRKSVNALWVPGLGRRARSVAATRVIVKGARAAIRVDGFTLHAATSKKALSGGLIPAYDWPGYEFGARTRKASFTQRSRLGKSYTVSKTVNRQFQGRQTTGQIAYETASEVGTKTVAAWVRAAVTTIVQATGGKASNAD